MLHHLLPLLFFTGFIAGTIDAIAGGGGLITLPALLSVGLPPHMALGTNKMQGMFGTAIATHTYLKRGWLKGQKLFLGLFCSFIGAAAGAIASQLFSNELLKKIIPAFLLVILVYIIFCPRLGEYDQKPRISETWFFIFFGSLLGFYDGFLGPGTGSFWVFCLTFFLGKNLLKATAYTKAFNLNTNIIAVTCFALGGNIDYRIALVMAAGQLLGGKLGALLAVKNGAKLIRPIFIAVVMATMMMLIYKELKPGSLMLTKPLATFSSPRSSPAV